MSPQHYILDRRDLRKTYGIRASSSTLLRWEAGGIFPRRVRPGGAHIVGWLRSEVEAYVADLAKQRGAR